jgi:hypothetical protein
VRISTSDQTRAIMIVPNLRRHLAISKKNIKKHKMTIG